jgi:putative endonuclease
MDRIFYVYILTNVFRSVLYIDVTNNLARRLEEHKSKSVAGFTSKYRLEYLVYAESFEDALSAIAREKQLKNWRRSKKERLIQSMNPGWDDLRGSVLL